MTFSPTKVNSGNSRPVNQINVLNAENRDVEREQLNRILSSLGERISVVESSSGSSSGGGGSSSFTITTDSSLSAIAGTDTYQISVAVGGITENRLASNAVTTAKIANNAVTTAKLADSNVTYAKIQNVTSDRLLGRDTASSGVVEEIGLNSSLAWSGTGSIGINLANANTWTATQTFSSIIVNDNTTLGSSNADTINVVGRFSSGLDPATDNAYDLGRTGNEWRDLYIDGTAYLDAVDIDGGSIDGTPIGATTPSTGAFTTLSTTGNATINGQLTLSGTIPRINLTDTNTGADSYVSADSSVGSLTFAADDNNETANSALNFRSDGSAVGSWTTTGLSITGTLSVSDYIRSGGAQQSNQFNSSFVTEGASALDHGLGIEGYRTSAGTAAFIIMSSARGTYASPSASANNDAVASWFAEGYDGAAFRRIGNATFEVDGAVASGDVPGRWVLRLAPAASSGAVSEVLRATHNAVSITGTLSTTTSTSTGDYYQVTDVHTIDANTGTQNLTVNWSNGSVQKAQRGGNFTINTITGPSEHMVSCTLYVYDTSSIATITYPSNMRFLSTGGAILAGGAGTWAYNGFWDGSSFWVNGFSRESGDQRPS